MKQTTKHLFIFLMTFVLAFSCITVCPRQAYAAAKKVRLDKTKISINEGKTKIISIKGVKKDIVKKIKVKSKNNKIVTAKKKGKIAIKVTGKKKGNTKVTVELNLKKKVNGKKKYKLTLKVQVKKKVDTSTVNAPILTQLEDAEYKVGDTAKPIKVTATTNNGGILSYQWYRADDESGIGTAIEGATTDSFTPPTAKVGKQYYYVVVTETKKIEDGSISSADKDDDDDKESDDESGKAESDVKTIIKTATSNRAKITVKPINPVVSELTDAEYVVGDVAKVLSVKATVTDGGTLSYQWYKATSKTADGTAIKDATKETFTPEIKEAGESYYYVVVTNTNNGLTTTYKSNVCKVTVTAMPQLDTPVIKSASCVLSILAAEESAHGVHLFMDIEGNDDVDVEYTISIYRKDTGVNGNKLAEITEKDKVVLKNGVFVESTISDTMPILIVVKASANGYKDSQASTETEIEIGKIMVEK